MPWLKKNAIPGCILLVFCILIANRDRISSSTPAGNNAPTSAQPSDQKNEACAQPRQKSIGYLVTRVVEKHWAGTDVDVISITKSPPAHESQAYGVFIAYPMSPGDMYFRDYKSCDAGKTWTADDKMRILPKSLIHQTRLAP